MKTQLLILTLLLSLPAHAGPIRHRIEQALKERVQLVAPQGHLPLQYRIPAVEIDLDSLHNRHWKTGMAFPAGGVSVFVGGTSSRARRAYLTALVEGSPTPKLFEVGELSEAPAELAVGGRAYTLSLRLSVFNPASSRLVFEGLDGALESHSASLKTLFDALYAAGAEVKLALGTYRVLYGSDVLETPQEPSLDDARRTLAFVAKQDQKLFTFLVAVEDLSSEAITRFRLQDGVPVGLALEGSTLRIYELRN